MIEENVLINQITSFMKEKNIFELEDMSPRQKESIWYILCKKIIGKYIFKEAQYIRQAWLKNFNNVKTKIFQD